MNSCVNNHEDKKKRSQNFSNEEKITLLNIISLYKDLIENKHTDAISNKQKNEAWEKICNNFNSACPDSQHRSVTVLKKFYENKKKEVRKLVAEEKAQINGTGGGPSRTIKKDACFDMILSIINHKTVYGLKNKFADLADPPGRITAITEINTDAYEFELRREEDSAGEKVIFC